MSATDVAILRIERTFAASARDVFDAWTNPEVLQRWWVADPTWTSPGCEVDLRVGGRYVMRMRDEQTGHVHEVAGEYREVDPPHRLVYTWAWQGQDGPHPGHESLVAVDFRADGDESTTVVIEHSGLASEESRAQHSHGWNGVLDNYERRILGA